MIGPRRTLFSTRAPFFDDDGVVDARLLVDDAVAAWAHRAEHHAVGVQHVVHLAGVDPVAVHDLGVDAQPAVDEALDGVGDFELAAPEGLSVGHDLVDGRVEHVDADDGEVARRVLRLLDDAANAPL